MQYSLIFVFSVVLVTYFSEEANAVNLYGNQHREPYRQDVVNIGNGVNRHNVVVLDQNPGANSGYPRDGVQPDVLTYRFGPEPSPAAIPPNNYPRNGVQNHNTVVVGNNRPVPQNYPTNSRPNTGTSFVSPSGKDLFNVGYGTNNHNQILINGRPVQPARPMNSGSRTQYSDSGTQYSSGGTQYSSSGTQYGSSGTQYPNSAGQTPGYGQNNNNNRVVVNGKEIQPDYVRGGWSTYNVNNQAIHVLNTGNKKTTPWLINRDSQLRTLYALYSEIEILKSYIEDEAQRLNINLY